MIDFNFITELEGFKLEAYVPEPDGGQIESGVTIASGFDLGQRNASDLPDWMSDRFDVYCGVTGYEAQRMLNALPLTLTMDEAVKVNEFAHNEAVGALLNDWPRYAVPFALLSDECQTVVASVAFQYGDLPTRTPNFWNQITRGKWFDALANLRNFGDAYTTRRNKEADLLEGRLNG